MDSLWVPIIVVAVIALVVYLRRQSAKAEEQRKVDEFRQLQAKVNAEDRARAVAAAPAAGGGLLQDAADRAAGKRYEQATGALEEQASELTRARQEAERAADRLADRAEEAMAAVQAAASPHGGAVPGDGTHDCPPGYLIKGNMPSRRYHEPGQLSYDRTIPEVCFQSVEAAAAAGFAPAHDDPGMRGRAAPVDEAVAAVAEEIEVVGGRGRQGIVADAAAAEAVMLREDDVAFVEEVEEVAVTGEVPPGAVRGDGSRDCPPTYPIKASEQARRYSMPGSGAYAATTPDLCFSSVESAEAAGYSSLR